MIPIHVFTDGACKGNPGPMGIGILIIPDLSDPNSAIKIQKYLGKGTNNVAELTAIDMALDKLLELNLNRPVALWTDSQYSINVLTRFKAKVNRDLIRSIKTKMLLYKPGIKLMYVAGHKDNQFNILVDKLASDAAAQGR